MGPVVSIFKLTNGEGESRHRTGLLALFFNTDLEGAQELGVLISEMELSIVALVRRQFLAVHQVGLASLVKADRDFKNQKQIIARRPDPPHHVSNSI